MSTIKVEKKETTQDNYHFHISIFIFIVLVILVIVLMFIPSIPVSLISDSSGVRYVAVPAVPEYGGQIKVLSNRALP